MEVKRMAADRQYSPLGAILNENISEHLPGLTSEEERVISAMLWVQRKAIRDYTTPDNGAVGFATLAVKPGNMRRHFRRLGFTRRGRGTYETTIFCPGYQSLDAHEYVAKAMADRLNAYGIEAYAWGRLD